MHFAYPRECPYPQVSGTTRLQTHGEWTRETGTDSSFSVAEIKSYIKSTHDVTGGGAASERGEEQQDEEGMRSVAMWVMEEELVDVVNGKPTSSIWPGIRAALRVFTFAVVLASFAVGVWSFASQGLALLARADGRKPLLAKLVKLGLFDAKAGEKHFV